MIVKSAKEIKKAAKLSDLVIAKPSKQNLRAFVERLPCDAVVDVEILEARDPLHFRASGLNQVLARILSRKEKFLCVSFSTLLNSENKQVLLGRIAQNVVLCKKYDVPIIAGSFARTPFEMIYFHDVVSFFSVFRVEPKKTKQNYKKLIDRILFNRKKKTHSFVAKGIEIVE